MLGTLRTKCWGKIVRLLGEMVEMCILCIFRRCADFTVVPSDPKVNSMWEQALSYLLQNNPVFPRPFYTHYAFWGIIKCVCTKAGKALLNHLRFQKASLPREAPGPLKQTLTWWEAGSAPVARVWRLSWGTRPSLTRSAERVLVPVDRALPLQPQCRLPHPKSTSHAEAV